MLKNVIMIFMVLYFFIALIGLSVGSFLSVLISRLDRKKGLLRGRSQCPRCSAVLKWPDLIPLASYIYLKGRCRYCKTKIAPTYPLIELLTGLIFVFYIYLHGFQPSIALAYYLLILSLLVALIFFDILYFTIPDKVALALLFSAAVFNIFFRSSEIANLFLSGLLFGSTFAIIHMASGGRWMGLGDAKLALAIGFILGYPLGFFALTLSIWTAALWGISLLLFKKATLKTPLPFGSFMAAAAIISIIFQNEIQTILPIIY